MKPRQQTAAVLCQFQQATSLKDEKRVDVVRLRRLSNLFLSEKRSFYLLKRRDKSGEANHFECIRYE